MDCRFRIVVLEAWLPSEEDANAIADVLFGDFNPGGKLPITFPRTVGQLPIFYGHRPSGGHSYWKENFVETSVKPLYPFGYGLSYTRFEFSNLHIEPATAQVSGEVMVQIDITNVGERSGDEVVQLYTRQDVSFVTRPVKELKAFKRVMIESYQTRTIIFRLAVNQFGFYDRELNFAVESGKVELMIGSSSEDILYTGSFEIQSEKQDIKRNKVFFSESRLL